MKKNFILIVTGIFGLITGIIFTMIMMWNMAPSMMLIEDESKYDFDKSIAVFEKAVIDNGWKIPVVHDLQKTMNKFGKDVSKVTVFELCHPDHAYEILSRDAERVVSSLMPCRIAIYEKSNGKTYVSRMNTGLMGQMMNGVVPEVMGIASHESEIIAQSIIK